MPTTLHNEDKLLEAARAHDVAAFDRLVTHYQDHLYRLLVRACHHPQDAEEVTVEAFARAYEKLAQFEGRSSFVTWLGSIATNLCFRRREKKELPSVSLDALTHDEENSAGSEPSAPQSSPEDAMLRTEMQRMIRSAIAQLPEPDQTVLRLRDIEQLPAEEVSTRTGLSVPAVKSRLHRARRALRARLNSYFLPEYSDAA